MNQQLFDQLVIAGRRHNVEVTFEAAPTYGNKPPVKRIAYYNQTHGSIHFGCYLGPFTDEAISDFIAYLDNQEPSEETIMNIFSTDLFTYLAGDMIGASQITMTIANVTLENMNSGKGGNQTKPCLHFRERDKLMVLNKTNAKTLAAILGPETENWKGARVTIAAPVVDAFGKSARSLRITDIEPPQQIAVKSRNGNGNGVANAANALADEIEAATNAPLFDMAEPPAPGSEYKQD